MGDWAEECFVGVGTSPDASSSVFLNSEYKIHIAYSLTKPLNLDYLQEITESSVHGLP